MAEACRLKQDWPRLMSIGDELRRTPGAGVEVAMLQRGLALVGMRRLPEAKDLLSRARDVLRRRTRVVGNWMPELRDLAAEVSAESGDLPAACREARTAIELAAARGGEVGEGRHPLTYYHRRLGDFLRRRGQLGEAMHWYARCLTQDPGDGLALFGTAIVMEKRGDRAGALQRYQRFTHLWARAPSTVPEVRCARAKLAEVTAAKGRSR
jgi:tetratricopeptide (TPR) repeat protein